jgi:uncharacterized iron-regulated protein
LFQDPSAHHLQLKILEKVFSASQKQNLKIGFSLEFYDRGSQTILNEYLSGFLDYDAFVYEVGNAAPGNHDDYKPLLEFCKQSKLPVIAANCPRRYSKMAGKNGREILENLPDKSRSLFAPLPYQKPSEAYCQVILLSLKDKLVIKYR